MRDRVATSPDPPHDALETASAALTGPPPFPLPEDPMTLRAPSRSLALTLALGLALAACGKDEPPAPAPPPAPAAATALPAAPTAPPAAPAEAPAPAPADVAPAGPGAPLTPISLPSFDPAVTAVIATAGLAPLADALARTGAALGDTPLPPNPLDALLEALRMRFGLTDTAWLDTAGPVRLAVPDPKAFPDGFLVLLPLRGGEEALRKGLGNALTASPGHLGALAVPPPGALFVDLVGDHVALTSHPDLLEKLAPFAKDTLLPWTPADPIVLEVSVSNLRRAFADELAQARLVSQNLSDQLSQRANIPMQASTLKALIDGAFGFVDGADRLGLSLDPAGSRVRLGFGLRGVEGSSLATSFAGLEGRSVALTDAVPATAWFGLASNVPSALNLPERATLVEQLSGTGGLGLSVPAAERFADHALAFVAASSGDNVQAVATDGAFPFAWTSLMAVSDREKARAGLMGILEVLLEHGLAAGRVKLAEGGVAPPLTNLTELVAFLNGLGQSVGATLAVKDETRDGARVAGLQIKLDWERLSQAPADPAALEAVRALVGPELSLALADGEGRLALALGPHAFDQAAALAAGRRPGGEPTLTAAGQGAFAAMSLRVGAMLSALSALPSFKARAAEFAKLPQGEAVTFAATAKGGTLVITADMALSFLPALMR